MLLTFAWQKDSPEVSPEMFAICVTDKAAGPGSLHGRKEFATDSLTQIFDMGTSDIVRSNDMKPIVIISKLIKKQLGNQMTNMI